MVEQLARPSSLHANTKEGQGGCASKAEVLATLATFSGVLALVGLVQGPIFIAWLSAQCPWYKAPLGQINRAAPSVTRQPGMSAKRRSAVWTEKSIHLGFDRNQAFKLPGRLPMTVRAGRAPLLQAFHGMLFFSTSSQCSGFAFAQGRPQ